MNSVITKTFEIGSNEKIEIPRTKAGQTLILKKINVDKIDVAGAGIVPDNIVLTLNINSWPVLNRYAGTLLSSKPNTLVLNHEFDADDDIRLEVGQIVPAVTTDKVLLTLSIDYKNKENEKN